MSSPNGEVQGDEQTPVARLCHIVKWEHFDGYGFNLHAEKGKPGQIIGKVDEGSPAEAAGLKEGDRIVEVNGVNIANENHKQVVQRIKAVEDETKLLVVDAEADKYFKNKNIVIKSSLPNVAHLKTPPSPTVNGKNNEKRESDPSDMPDAPGTPSSPSTPGRSTPSSDRKASLQSGESSPETDQATNENGTMERQNNTLNLNMTAAELKAQLASRKNRKNEVKRETIDFKQKYDIIQKL